MQRKFIRRYIPTSRPTNLCYLTAMLLASFSSSQASDTQLQGNTLVTQLAEHFSSSTLSFDQREDELRWFQNAAKPYQGMKINVVSEDIPTHRYESLELARMFTQLTGIQVIHEVVGEDDLVKRLQLHMQTDLSIYDGYVNDTDFIGTHIRSQKVVPISEFMKNEWKHLTLPTLDIDDFIGLKFAKDENGTVYQLPDQQFANLYWYRHDWFSRQDLQQQFEQKYGYPLAVPQNWRAYQDIAHFFTYDVKEIDGERIWGHFDYGKYEPSLGWRISDSWLSLAGVNDVGLPSGSPVGDWGIRAENCVPVGSSVSRGGALNSPAAIYALEKYKFWLNEYAPPESKTLTFRTTADWLAQGKVAQQIFWYSAFIPTLLAPDSKVIDENGHPLWRLAPSPRGQYWQPGMKSGYQDAGSWTFLQSTPAKQREAAWLYAQFTVSKTVSFDKLLHGFTPIRHSDVHSEGFTQLKPKLGGLVEFYQSPAKHVWTPSGVNIPDYSTMAAMWWQHIGDFLYSDITATQTLNQLAGKFDQHLATLSSDDSLLCRPQLSKERPVEYWLNQPGSPWPKRVGEPEGKTLPFSEVYDVWNTLED
ncbi:ABC transporter substrate-binding protein [Vibrio sp. RE88]|uniref:ABC transporter substrate-binding protein n=1 Tax=Vibrio sp. RE88 TaxID=2607610 RepID=UPI0014939AA9|nr:ABC transporter substrate-binding protein [Vibrio sp. RE88]NOH64894.1 carbohydrate ABC transporter substrate-binding protein [Vibrio sp. RE88]